MSMNKVILIGNLGRDAELKYTPAGAAVATLSLATTETWKDREGVKQQKTEWHRVVLWGKAAEGLAEYLTKGKQIAVEGKIETRKWTDKDGNDKYSTEIKADQIRFLNSDGRAEGVTRKPAKAAKAAEPERASDETGYGSDDDIPF